MYLFRIFFHIEMFMTRKCVKISIIFTQNEELNTQLRTRKENQPFIFALTKTLR